VLSAAATELLSMSMLLLDLSSMSHTAVLRAEPVGIDFWTDGQKEIFPRLGISWSLESTWGWVLIELLKCRKFSDG
jgi:hypothetical protein